MVVGVGPHRLPLGFDFDSVSARRVQSRKRQNKKQNKTENNLLTGLLKKTKKEKKQDNKQTEPQPGKYSCFQSGGI